MIKSASWAGPVTGISCCASSRATRKQSSSPSPRAKRPALLSRAPSLRGAVALAYSDPVSPRPVRECFSAHNTVAMGQAKALVEAGVRVVDLSADFRIKNVAEWEKLKSSTHRTHSLRRCTVCRK
jgi:N-acetyl-gamma-glutamylphosphate reductase